MNEKFQYRIVNFEFIISEREQVNPHNSRAMSALKFLLFKLINTLQIKSSNFESVEAIWCNDSGVLNLHQDNDGKVVVSSQPSIMGYKLANQKIRILTVYES